MKTKYEMVWRNKFLTIEAKSFKEMVIMLEESAKTLREIFETGKVKLVSGSAGDDYATLITTDKEVADRFGFMEIDPEEEE